MMTRTEKSKANSRQKRKANSRQKNKANSRQKGKANGRQDKDIANSRQSEPEDCDRDKAKYEEKHITEESCSQPVPKHPRTDADVQQGQYELKLGEVCTTILSIDFNVETVEYKTQSFTVQNDTEVIHREIKRRNEGQPLLEGEPVRILGKKSTERLETLGDSSSRLLIIQARLRQRNLVPDTAVEETNAKIAGLVSEILIKDDAVPARKSLLADKKLEETLVREQDFHRL